MSLKEQALKILESFQDPTLKEFMQSFSVQEGKISFILEAPPDQVQVFEKLRQQLETSLKDIKGVQSVQGILTAHKPPHKPSHEKLNPKGVKHLIVVASGKGGVGKSTTAVNLAVALTLLGKKVGLLDADIYGPSLPKMLNISEKPYVNEKKKLIPYEKYGLKVISIGLLIPENSPIIWRGPMIQGALMQLLKEVAWDDLDILMIDMPPGTGDIPLTLVQQTTLSGAIIVSTPQDIALIDARKAIRMFEKVSVPILGIIENMSFYTCPKCGYEEDIFHHGGAKEEAKKFNIPFLGEIPLKRDIRLKGDEGIPLAMSSSDKRYYEKIAQQILEQLSF